jgi:hypothetical protein
MNILPQITDAMQVILTESTVIRKGVLHKHPNFLLYFQKSQNMLRKAEPM